MHRAYRYSLSAICLTALCLTVQAGGQANVDTRAFETHAIIAINERQLTLTTTVATIEPARTFRGSSWVRIYFYAFPLNEDDMKGVRVGSVASMDRRWHQLSRNKYNSSRAVVQLTIDDTSNVVGQVDMSVPGHACTVAWQLSDLERFRKDYRFDGKRLRIKNSGSHTCEAQDRQTFRWSIDIDIPVFAVAGPH